MLCIPLVGPTYADLYAQKEAAISMASLFEIRIDLLEKIDLEELKKFRASLTLPVIFTLRKKTEGGKWEGSEQQRVALLKKLALLQPTYLDVEKGTKGTFKGTTVLVSHHDFSQTPALLPSNVHKLATQASSTLDALRMLVHMRTHAPFLGMCMGEKGEITRILGPLFGAPWVYAALHSTQKTATGQLTAEELRRIYQVTTQKGLYALIGGDVSKSVSHYTHNSAMRALHLDSVYVKMSVEESELAAFFKLSREAGFKGLSVTMPLKEKVIPFLDEISTRAKEIGAVNTIAYKEGALFGTNTDGQGALDALERHGKVAGKHVVILGAGGAARALIYEALQRGGQVTVLSRSVDKALVLATHFSIKAAHLSDFDPLACDFLINATPESFTLPFSAQTIVMDINTIPQWSSLLLQAREKGCRLVFGYEMFINQAVLQFQLWYPSLCLTSLKKALTEELHLHVS